MSSNSSAVNELNNALLMITGSVGVEKNAKYISLHTGNPGTSGANEVAGGAYTRVATTWGAIAGGSVTGSQVSISVPIGTTISYWGLWDAVSSGNYYDGGQLPTAVNFASAGNYLITVTLTAS